MPACHAGDRGFKSRPDRHYCGSVAQLVEQWPEEPRVGGSIPSGATTSSISFLVRPGKILTKMIAIGYHIRGIFTMNILKLKQFRENLKLSQREIAKN